MNHGENTLTTKPLIKDNEGQILNCSGWKAIG